MKVLGMNKWVILSTLVLLSLSGLTNAVINTCGTNFKTSPNSPTKFSDCTLPDPDDGTCCFVEVQLSSTNTLRYCSFIPGPYVKEKAMDNFKMDTLFAGKTTVNCNASFLAYSLSVLLVIFITLL